MVSGGTRNDGNNCQGECSYEKKRSQVRMLSSLEADYKSRAPLVDSYWKYGRRSRHNNLFFASNEGLVVWFTGLSSSGKTTLSRAVYDLLVQEGIARKSSMETFHHPAARRIGQRAVDTIDRFCSAGSAQALRGLTSTFQNSGSFIIPLSDMNSGQSRVQSNRILRSIPKSIASGSYFRSASAGSTLIKSLSQL
jgi:hypothetical protein